MSHQANMLFFLGAAVVGLVSAAGVYLIEQFRQERRRHVFTEDLARVDGQLTNLREELEVMRRLQTDRSNNSAQLKPNRRRLRNSSAVSVASSEDYRSAVDENSSDLEFFDLSSEEDNTADKSGIDKDIKEIDTLLENETECETALRRLEALVSKHPRDVEVLWRIGKALKFKVDRTSEPEQRKLLICRGMDYCEKAVALKPNSAPGHKWMAILVGLRSEFLPMKEKLANSQLLKSHVEKALELAPNDAVLHHILGRFAYEFAQLNWFEKAVASTLIETLPSYSHQDALDSFLDAEKYSDKEWKENRLFIAKCQLAIGSTDSAVQWLHKAERSTSEEDEKVHEEVQCLLQKHSKQR